MHSLKCKYYAKSNIKKETPLLSLFPPPSPVPLSKYFSFFYYLLVGLPRWR